VNFPLVLAGFSSVLIALGLGGCANESVSQTRFPAPTYLGSDLANMGGARSANVDGPDADLIIEPTSSSKVLSAVVFERVTGRTAYPDGPILGK
jgi:hypothetical protein